MSTLNSKIILAKGIKMDREYNNVLSFGTNRILELLNSNTHYVNSSIKFSFIGGRGTNVISCPFTYNQCLISNYIAFQNTDYSSKWFFAFITNVKYVSPGTTEIEFEIDAWTTWFEDWTKKPCFVNRHHVNDDTIGVNTVPENLDVGEVEQESFDEFLTYGQDGSDYYFCINTTYDPILEKDFEGVTKINGNLYGCYIYCFDVFSSNAGVTNVTNFIYKTNQDQKINSIQEIYILPKTLIDAIGKTAKSYTAVTGSFNCYLLNSSSDVVSIPQSFTKTHSFSQYQPKNSKCFVYPYNYMLLSNNCGNNNIYKYENFKQANPIFEIEMAVSVGGSIRIVPREYKNIDYDYDESLPLAKFPTCSWSSDAFINWLSQNAVNIGTQIVATGVNAFVGNYASVAGQVAGLIGQFREALLLPNITGGGNNGDVNFSARKNTFSLYHMRCKLEYMRIIDDYFSRFRLCY